MLVQTLHMGNSQSTTLRQTEDPHIAIGGRSTHRNWQWLQTNEQWQWQWQLAVAVAVAIATIPMASVLISEWLRVRVLQLKRHSIRTGITTTITGITVDHHVLAIANITMIDSQSRSYVSKLAVTRCQTLVIEKQPDNARKLQGSSPKPLHS